MIRLTVKSSTENLYNFIDNRLCLLMAEKKIRPDQVGIPKVDLDKAILNYEFKEIVERTVYYIEKNPDRSSLLIKAKAGDKNLFCGMAVRKKGIDQLELYLDSIDQAIAKGIITKPGARMSIVKILLGLLFIAAAFVLFWAVLLTAIVMTLGYPIIYLMLKREFKKKQTTLNTLMSIFEAEFPSSNKTDSKDWVNFFGRVKSGAAEVLNPF